MNAAVFFQIFLEAYEREARNNIIKKLFVDLNVFICYNKLISLKEKCIIF